MVTMRNSRHHAFNRLFGTENAENEMYGHASVFRKYCSRRFTTPIPGLVQHGWSYGPGIASVNFDHFTENPSHRAFVWNQRNAADCHGVGLDRVRAIGAPLLYLPRDTVPEAASEPGSLLLFPSHSCEWEPYVDSAEEIFGTYFDQMKPVLSEFSSITVCLYWREYEIRALRNLIHHRGFHVTTLGHRDGNPDFLYRLRKLVLEHEYVSTNSFSTALFYSLFLNRKTFTYGTTFVNNLLPGKPDNKTIHESMGRRYPELAWEKFGDRCHADIGADEIGAELKLSRSELCDAFDWSTLRRLRSVSLRLWSAVARRLKI